MTTPTIPSSPARQAAVAELRALAAYLDCNPEAATEASDWARGLEGGFADLALLEHTLRQEAKGAARAGVLGLADRYADASKSVAAIAAAELDWAIALTLLNDVPSPPTEADLAFFAEAERDARLLEARQDAAGVSA